jgi:hypothetical protein
MRRHVKRYGAGVEELAYEEFTYSSYVYPECT